MYEIIHMEQGKENSRNNPHEHNLKLKFKMNDEGGRRRKIIHELEM